MVEKIIFDKNIIRKITNRNDISILFVKLNTKERKAFYRTDSCTNYRFIDIQKVMNL